MKIKLVDNYNRDDLSEGRTYGAAFAFVKQTGEASYETVIPPSTCKDYLNDVVSAERYGIDISVYGADVKPTGLFKNSAPKLYVTVLKDSDGKRGDNYAVAPRKKRLVTNIEKIVAVMANIDRILGQKTETTFLTVSPRGKYIFVIPEVWVKYSYMISLYTLIVRMLMDTTLPSVEEINKMSFDDILSLLDKSETKIDGRLWKQANPAFVALKDLVLEDKLPDDGLIKAIEDKDMYTIHNAGILSLRNPKTKNTYYTDKLKAQVSAKK